MINIEILFESGQKITVKHFLNNKTKPLIRNFPPDELPNANKKFQEYYPYYVQVIFKRKINSKSSFFYKFVGIDSFKAKIPDEYVSKEGSLMGFGDIIETAIEDERINLILTLQLAKELDKEEFTLSNFAHIHKISTKSIINYVESYFKNPMIMGSLLLKYHLQELPFIAKDEISFQKLYLTIDEIIKNIFKTNADNSQDEISNLIEVNRLVLNDIKNLYPKYLTPILWNELKMSDKLISKSKEHHVKFQEKYSQCIKSVDEACQQDLKAILGLFVKK